MIDEIVIECKGNLKRIACLNNGKLCNFIIHDDKKASEGNIYIGKIVKKIKTANGKDGYFVNIGDDKDAFINAEEPGLENLVANEGQGIIVQVQQEKRAEKGAKLTRFIGLAGNNLVYKPYGEGIELSSKIKDDDVIENLYNLVSEKVFDGGWIIRTQAEKTKKEDIFLEIENLTSLFNDIQIKAKSTKAPSLLYMKNNILDEIILKNKEYLKKIVVNNHLLEEELNKYNIVEYNVEPFFNNGIDEMLLEALQKQVKLPCGGRIFIEETKAFVSIDVDSGEGYIQGGAGILNQEAAYEIARQIILRNLSGKIIIDFAGIPEYKFLKKSIDILTQELSFDSIKSIVLGLTRAGNIEIIRTRRRSSLGDLLTEECSVCSGTGRVEK